MPPGADTENVAGEIVESIMSSLNVAVMAAMPTAPSAGVMELTVGGVMSPDGPVGAVGLELLLLHPAEIARIMASPKRVCARLFVVFIMTLTS